MNIQIPQQLITVPSYSINVPDSQTSSEVNFFARKKFDFYKFPNIKLSDATQIHSNSAGMVTELVRQCTPNGSDVLYFPNLNTSSYSAPIYIVTDSAMAKTPVKIIQNGVELSNLLLDKFMNQGIRIPDSLQVSAGTDGEVVIWDQVDDIVYEFWQLKKVNGAWQASWGGWIPDVSHNESIFQTLLDGVKMGATATGISLLGTIMTLEELKSGVVKHTIGFAILQGPNKYVWPAQRTDTNAKYYEGPNSIPAGTRFKFPSNIVISSSWVPIVKIMVAAIRDYGCVVQDRAGAVSFYAEDTIHSGLGDQVATGFFGGQQPWQFLDPKVFPFGKLIALA